MTSRVRLAIGLIAVLLLPLGAPALDAQTQTALRDEVRGSPASLLDRPAGLVVRGVTLEAALTRLTETSGVVVVFSPSLLRANSRQVTCECRDRRVGEALDLLLTGTFFGYSVMDGQIALMPKTMPGPVIRVRTGWLENAQFAADGQISPPWARREATNVQVGTVVGRVTDAQTGNGLDGVRVSLEGTTLGTLTDREGDYRVSDVPPGSYTLVASRIGYGSERRTVTVTPGQESTVNVALEAAPTALQEIVVTAQKREERLLDVPISIAVVTADDIDRRGLVSAEDYLRGIPGVNQADAQWGQAVVIRGIETQPQWHNFFAAASVATYFGETPTTSSQGMSGNSNIDLKVVDVERVEVLRGPQGTAFGSSAVGGVLRTIPVAPKLDRVEGKVAAGYSITGGTGGGNYNVQAVGNLPLIRDKLAIRAVGYRYEESGFYRSVAGSAPNVLVESTVNQYGGQAFATDGDGIGATRFTGGRVAALFQASDDLQFTLSYLTHKAERDGFAAANSGTGRYDQAFLEIAPEHTLRGQKRGFNDTDTDIANAKMEYDIGWANLLGTYSYIRSGAIYVDPFTAYAIPWPLSTGAWADQRGHVGEIRLTTQLEGAWNFLGGLYAEDLDDEATWDAWWQGSPETNFMTGRAGSLGENLYHRNLTQKAVFGEASWEFLPGFTLTGGARVFEYDRTERHETVEWLGGASRVTNTAADASGTSFRGNLSHKLSDNALVYAGWSQGFRLGRAQPEAPANLCDLDGDGFVDGTNFTIKSTGIVNSDLVNNYELGGKYMLLDRRLLITADVYRIEWSDVPVLVSAPTHAEGGCSVRWVANAGTARSEGIEFQTNFYVTEAFRVDVGGSWIRARLTNDVPAMGAFTGDRLPGSPDFNANLGLQYDFTVGSSSAFLRVDPIYVGSFYANFPQEPNTKAGGNVKVDGSARVGLGHLDVRLLVRNLTNADDFTYRDVRNRGELYGYRLRPRTIGLELSRNF